MDWFGRGKRNRAEFEAALLKITAYLNCMEATVFGLLSILPPERRDQVLDVVRLIIADMRKLDTPSYISDDQGYRNEVSRIMQRFVKIIEGPHEISN